MTGEEHYVEAERLAKRVVQWEDDRTPPGNEEGNTWAGDTIALAQVHATLALAAATARAGISTDGYGKGSG